MKILKHAIIGCGGISPKHLNGYASIPDRAVTVAACDLILDRALEAQKNFPSIQKVYTDYHEMLKDPEIDIVSVCLPNHLHMPVSIDVMRAGKHVHCEKPMAMSYQEAAEMLKVRNETGRKMMIGLNNRFTPYAQFVKNYIDEGNLGELYYAKCGWLDRNMLPPSSWFTDKSKAGGGALIDVGVHFIDLALYFMGYPAMKSVLGQTFSRIIDRVDYRQLYAAPGVVMGADDVFDVEELACGMVTLEGGRSVSFELSWASNIQGDKQFYELYGTKAGVKFEFTPENEKEPLSIYTTSGSQMIDIKPIIAKELYPRSEFSTLADAILNGENIDSVAEQAAQMMKLIDAIYKSSGTGESVRV